MPSPAAQFLSSFAPSTRTLHGQTIAGYSLGPTVGYGSTSVIRKAFSPSGSVAAVKVVALVSPSNLKHHLREAATWSLLSHEHILPLFAFHHSVSHIYFFTLYCPAGSLLDVLRSLGSPALLQDDAGMIFRQVVRGLRYLHEEALFVHRDIKLENILIDEMGFCRIADFGLAVRIDSSPPDSDHDDDDCPDPDRPRTVPRYHRNSTSSHSLLSLHHHNNHNHFQPGSLPYVPPELLLPRPIDLLPHHSRPHPSQDIWALGVLLYALLSGSLPFFDTFEPRLQLKILNGSYSPLHDIGLGAERILKGCLDKSVFSRWSIAMVDEVAWGVGWGREGDGAGAGEIDDDDHIPSERIQINSSAYVHRDRHYQTGLQVERRARSKSLPPRSRSPPSPSPSYRFPPSPSSSCSPPPLSPPPARPIEVDVVSSPNIVASDFEVPPDIVRGRQMRPVSKQLESLSFR